MKHKTTIIPTLTIVLVLLLSACKKKHLTVQEQSTDHKGLVTQSVKIQSKKNAENKLLICFSEIKVDKLVGVSCQNDTGFHLFSAGLVDQAFISETPSRYVLNIEVSSIINYIKLALFTEYNIINDKKNALTVIKSDKKTTITDMIKRRTIEIDIL